MEFFTMLRRWEGEVCEEYVAETSACSISSLWSMRPQPGVSSSTVSAWSERQGRKNSTCRLYGETADDKK